MTYSGSKAHKIFTLERSGFDLRPTQDTLRRNLCDSLT